SLTGASFTSVAELRAHIDAFVDTYNEQAKPFACTKSEVYQKRLKARFADQLFRVLGAAMRAPVRRAGHGEVSLRVGKCEDMTVNRPQGAQFEISIDGTPA